MISWGYPQAVVIIFVSGMAIFGYYTNDKNLIAPLGSIIITFSLCGLCYGIEKYRNPDFNISTPLLPK
jgi:hypothetical protein